MEEPDDIASLMNDMQNFLPQMILKLRDVQEWVVADVDLANENQTDKEIVYAVTIGDLEDEEAAIEEEDNIINHVGAINDL